MLSLLLLHGYECGEEYQQPTVNGIAEKSNCPLIFEYVSFLHLALLLVHAIEHLNMCSYHLSLFGPSHYVPKCIIYFVDIPKRKHGFYYLFLYCSYFVVLSIEHIELCAKCCKFSLSVAYHVAVQIFNIEI